MNFGIITVFIIHVFKRFITRVQRIHLTLVSVIYITNMHPYSISSHYTWLDTPNFVLFTSVYVFANFIINLNEISYINQKRIVRHNCAMSQNVCLKTQ